jgi:Sec-independent protein secretion pathway component TatC
MYVAIFIVLVLVIAISAVWSPIFALIIAVPLFALFLAYVGFSRRADEKVTPPAGAPESEQHHHGGVWGEKEA